MSIKIPFFYLADCFQPSGSVIELSQYARSIRVSGVTEARDAHFGSSFRFSENAYFEADCQCPASFTLSLWVASLLDNNAAGQSRTLVEFGGGNVRLWLNDLKPSLNDLAIGPEKLPRNTFCHLAVSFDATTKTCALYVDGTRVATTTANLEPSPNTLPMRVGLGSQPNDLGFEGNLAHFVVYDRALSDDDILQVLWTTEKTMKPVLLLRDTTPRADGTIADESGSRSKCLAEGVTATVDTQRGPSFNFKNGYLELGTQICPSAFTLSAWIKLNANDNNTFFPLFEFGTDAPRLAIQDHKLTLTNGAACTTKLTPFVFQHIAAVYNPISGRSTLYIDGEPSATALSELDTSGFGLLIGTGSREVDPNFPGLMAHIAVHDAPLSHTDIKLLRDASAPRPRLHLPLEAIDLAGRTPDLSGYPTQAVCIGAVPVPDDTFGTAFAFDGENDAIDIATQTCTPSFTFAMYICPDAATIKRDAPLLEFGQQSPLISLSYGKLKMFGGPTVDASSALTAGTLYHIAATYNASTRQANLYINGDLVKSSEFTSSTSGLGLGIGHRYSANYFGGRMRHWMMYGEALSQDIIRQLIVLTSPHEARHVPPQTRPGVGLFSMDLVNGDDQPVLYLDGSQELSLSVENTWAGDITLATTTDPVGPDCYHFQLQFRQGTLSPSFRDELVAGHGEAIGALRNLGWALHCKNLDTGGDLLSLLFLNGASTPSTRPPLGVIQSKGRLLLPLAGLQPEIGAGSRTTRVVMRYSRMLLPDRTPVPEGQRIELLNLLARPREAPGTIAGVVASLIKHQITVDGKLPIEIKIDGGTSLLNDGGPNTIAITIKNTRRIDETPARLDLGTGMALDVSPKLYVSLPDLFDAIEGSTPDDIQGIQVSIKSTSTSLQHVWTCSLDGTRCRIKPPAAEPFFEPSETVTLTLTNIRTTEQNGTIYVRVRYEDILAFGEGEFYIPVRIAPLSFTRKADRDTVVIRHGNQGDADPSNEALFVETSEGYAARFVGGAGIFIDGPQNEANALRLRTRKTSANSALFIEKEGAAYGLQVNATSADSAAFIKQLGKGSALDICKHDANATLEVPSVAVYVDQKGKSSALRIDSSSVTEAGIRLDQTGPAKGLVINHSSDGDGLFVNKTGKGYAAEFIGGDGVLINNPSDEKSALGITTKTSSKTTALSVHQAGTGNAADLLGGSNGNAASLVGNSPKPALYVEQKGAGWSAHFKGGNVRIEGNDSSERVTLHVEGPGEFAGRVTDATGAIMPVGAIIAFGSSTAPQGWLLCDGQAIPSGSQYQELRNVLNKDNVPDLRGRFILAAGKGEWLSNRTLHDRGGEEWHTLTIDEMPSHSHAYHKARHNYGHKDGDGDWSRYGHEDGKNEDYTASEGSNNSHNNMPPYYVLTYIIKY